MREHRIYYTDTNPHSEIFGKRIEFMRGVPDATRAREIVEEMNCRRSFERTIGGAMNAISSLVSAEKRISTLYYHAEATCDRIGKLGDWFADNFSHHETIKNAEEAQDRPVQGDREGRRRTSDVPGDRAGVEGQPEERGEIPVRAAGPRTSDTRTRGEKGCRRIPTFNSSDRINSNPTFNSTS